MNSDFLLLLAADALLLLHALFVVFVVFSLPLILLGKPLNWNWVRSLWFRVAHLAAIGIVVVQSWFGMICPLTVWEVSLRKSAGDEVYFGTFIAHWLDTLLYYQAPAWVFIAVYTAFAALVVFSWFWVRPWPSGESISRKDVDSITAKSSNDARTNLRS